MIRDPLLPLIIVYAGAVAAVSLPLAAVATRLPCCHSVWVFLGVFGVLTVAGMWLGGRSVTALRDRRERGEQR